MSQPTPAPAASTRQLLAESLRLTAFAAASARVDASGWWTQLVGSSPETSTSKPGRAELREIGRVGTRNLLLSVLPGRVDWILVAPADAQAVDETRIGPFREALEAFRTLMLRWLQTCPPIVRLAFGAVVIEPVESRVAGYRNLSRYLRAVQLDAEGSQDFFYQVNRPRRSNVVDGLQINRLSKWSVAQSVPITLMLTPQSVQSGMGAGQEACRIEVDINTAPRENAELPSAMLPEILGELVWLGEEIVLAGDTP